MVHVVPSNWTNHNPGQSVRVLVYSNAESVELFLNDQSLGAKDVNPAEGHLEWSVEYAPGTLEARATSGGTVITDTVRTAGAPAALALVADRSTLRADGRDLAFVEIDVVDDDGIVVPGASNSIEVTVTGPGVLLGLDGGNAVNHESYKGSSMSAFSGKLMAIVGTSDEAGTIEVAVASGGLVGASTTLTTTK